jgi:hypothetical protein
MQNHCDFVKPKQTRKIKPTRRSVSGIYPFRGETAIAYESTLERDFLIRKEFNLYVLDIIPQPVQIPFTSNNGQVYTYTPDFLVYYRTLDGGDLGGIAVTKMSPQRIAGSRASRIMSAVAGVRLPIESSN